MSASDELLSTSLGAVLEESRKVGFLGPGPLATHVSHALAMVEAISGVSATGPLRIVDLGAGGGVPGLVMGVARPEWEIALLDASARRCEYLERAVGMLGIGERVRVLHGRAEELGRDGALRGRFEAVAARSFAGPATTAECARPFLSPGGHLVVAEPPEGGEGRWSGDLQALALVDIGETRRGGFAFRLLEAVGPCPERFPRRTGVPAKRPVF